MLKSKFLHVILVAVAEWKPRAVRGANVLAAIGLSEGRTVNPVRLPVSNPVRFLMHAE
jgi:hypothetical protein